MRGCIFISAGNNILLFIKLVDKLSSLVTKPMLRLLSVSGAEVRCFVRSVIIITKLKSY